MNWYVLDGSTRPSSHDDPAIPFPFPVTNPCLSTPFYVQVRRRRRFLARWVARWGHLSSYGPATVTTLLLVSRFRPTRFPSSTSPPPTNTIPFSNTFGQHGSPRRHLWPTRSQRHPAEGEMKKKGLTEGGLTREGLMKEGLTKDGH